MSRPPGREHPRGSGWPGCPQSLAHCAGVPCSLAHSFRRTAGDGLFLNGWALHGSIGTKHTTLPRFGFQQGAASHAFIEPLARINGHGFLLRVSAFRADNRGLKSNAAGHAFSRSFTSTGQAELAGDAKSHTETPNMSASAK